MFCQPADANTNKNVDPNEDSLTTQVQTIDWNLIYR